MAPATWIAIGLFGLALAGQAPAATTLTVAPATDTVPVNGTRTFTATLTGGSMPAVTWKVNGVRGGNSVVGTISKAGIYTAPAAVPSTNPVTLTATTTVRPTKSASAKVTIRLPIPCITGVTPNSLPLGAYTLTVNGDRFYSGAKVFANGVALATTFVSPKQLRATGTATQVGTLNLEVVNPGNVRSAVYTGVQVVSDPSPPPLPPQPPTTDPATLAAARFLEQASFGPTPNEIAAVKQVSPSAWLTHQLALPASPLPATSDLNVLRRGWYANMASGPDQVRQRMIFALSQIFVVSADKNPYGNEMLPWLQTLSSNALGNFGTLLREMTLNPSMGNTWTWQQHHAEPGRTTRAKHSSSPSACNLNQDGTLQQDGNGNRPDLRSGTRARNRPRAVGVTYRVERDGLNWEASPDRSSRATGITTRVRKRSSGVTLPAGNRAADYDAVMANVFAHPNVRRSSPRASSALVTSNPSPAYVKRVADVFANNGGGARRPAATARDPARSGAARHAYRGAGPPRDPIPHTLGDPHAVRQRHRPTNLFWDYTLMSQRLLNAPSVFNFYSPLTRLPESPQLYGPEFQIYAPSLAITRANFLYALIAGYYRSMIAIDIAPFVAVAGNATALIDLVDATLLQGRMSATARQAIATALAASSDNQQRAITALYLTAITGEFAVHR
jgi:uncharacterized protein (DUF1800 family)